MKSLRDKGLRQTVQRKELLALIAAAKKPISAVEIAQKLVGRLNKVTVYRSLDQLVEVGLVRRLELGGRAKYYEIDYGDDHHHLICEQCNRIEEVEMCHVADIEQGVLKSSQSFATVTRHSLEFYGLCKQCQKKTRG